MNDIYDVFRVLVEAARSHLADTVINEALTIVERHAAAARHPDPLTAAVQANAAILAGQQEDTGA